MSITADDFSAWRDNPVTQAVFRALKVTAERNKEAWVQVSWEGGNADRMQLIGLKARADAYLDLATISYADLEAALEG